MIDKITSRFSGMKIGTKILIICLILVIVPSLLIGTVAYITASNAINDQLDLTMTTQINDMRSMTSNSYDLSKAKLSGDLNLLRQRFTSYGSPEISGDKMVLGGQMTVNNNYQIVDEIEKEMGSKATIFQKIGDKAIRISTNVIGADGKRAVGTPVSDAVYEAVIKNGQTYYGTADVVGKKYVTVYEPIRNPRGEIIGILFVGVPEDSVYGPLKQEIRNTKVGESGYLYIMDSKGTFIVHPTAEGSNYGNEEFVRTMIADKDAVTGSTGRLTYLWQGKDAVAYYTYFAPMDWIIAGRMNTADFSGPVDNLRNAIIIILIISIAAGSWIALRFGNSIARRMGDLVVLGKKVMDGDFSYTTGTAGKTGDIRDVDEIGEVSEAFGGVVTNIQAFRDEITAISSAAVEGRLTVRGDAVKFKGGYATMIQGLNNTINAVVGHLDTIPVPAFIINKEYTVLYANKAASMMAGSSPQEMIGQKCYDHFRTPHCKTPQCASGQCMMSGRLVSAETQALPRGKKFDIAYSGVPIRDASGTIIGSMEFFTDLTEIREAGRKAQQRIEDALGFINNEMGKIQDGAGQANANVEEVSAGAGQVARNASAVSVNVEKSLESIMQVQRAMEDLSRTIQDVATRAEATAKIVHDTSAFSRDGMDLARRTEQGMQGITHSSGEVNQIIGDIKSEMDKISEIVSLITDLANQTNLLALNAAIEAARAGDAGRGFAVVATEVKSLAVESRASAERIAEMIENLQSQTNHAVEAVATANIGVREGSTALKDTVASFSRIAESIDVISHNISDVASATEEQAASVEEITASVNEVNGLIQNTAKEATDAAAASEESSASIEQIGKVIGNVTVVVENVREEINGFK